MKKLIIQNSHFQTLLIDFESWLATLNHPPKTVETLPIHTRELLHFLENQNPPIQHITELTKPLVKEFWVQVQQRKNERTGGGLSINHCNKMTVAINKFLNYLRSNQIHTLEMKLPRQKSFTAERTILTIEEVKQLYQATYTSHRQGNEALSLRDRAMLGIYYGAGCRLTEGTQLNITDLDWKTPALIVRKGKLNKQRIVPIPNTVAEDMYTYIQNGREFFLKENKTNTEALLLSMFGERMSHSGIHTRITQLVALAGINKRITAHCLRHSIATHLLEAGTDIILIAQMLGHSTLDSTQIYAHINKRNQNRQEMQRIWKQQTPFTNTSNV